MAQYRDTFSLPEGEATIEWPSPLSRASFDEFTEWLALVHRKIKRTTLDPYEDPGYGLPENPGMAVPSVVPLMTDDNDPPF